jgi:hypothetical protein
MESGVRLYNVDPLVEKAHFGKFTVMNLVDQNCKLSEFTHTQSHRHARIHKPTCTRVCRKPYRHNITVHKKMRCEMINAPLRLKETIYEVQNFQNVLWVTSVLAVSTCQLGT